MRYAIATAVILAGAGFCAGAASAQTYGGYGNDDAFDHHYYARASAGVSLMPDSDANGSLNDPFISGAGTTIAPGTVFPEGAQFGWKTDWNAGYALSGALGKDMGPLRAELELAYQRNNVKSSNEVFLGAAPLDGEDAAVLTAGLPPAGSTVGDYFATDSGDMDAVYVMANAYYDFDIADLPVTPFVGGGIGVGFVNVNMQPSGARLVDDRDAKFAWQAIAGASYDLTPRTDLYADLRYRATKDVEVDTTLLPATVSIQNRGPIVEAGVSYAF